MQSIVHSTPDAWPAQAAELAAGLLRSDIERSGAAALVVPGGQTAQVLLPVLAAVALDWKRVVITLSDERWVPADHPNSNEGLVRNALRNATGATIIGLKTEDTRPIDALGAIDARLSTVPKPFSACILGMGEDGHTASLFPGQDVPETGNLLTIERPDHPRVSLTPGCLLNSRGVILPIIGENKRRTFEAANAPGPTTQYPIRHIFHQDAVDVTVILA